MAAVFPASTWDQILWIVLIILGLVLAIVVLRFLLQVAAKILAYGCLVVFILAALYALLKYFGVL